MEGLFSFPLLPVGFQGNYSPVLHSSLSLPVLPGGMAPPRQKPSASLPRIIFLRHFLLGNGRKKGKTVHLVVLLFTCQIMQRIKSGAEGLKLSRLHGGGKHSGTEWRWTCTPLTMQTRAQYFIISLSYAVSPIFPPPSKYLVRCV